MENQTLFDHISNQERQGNHYLEALIDPKRISHADHDLSEKHNFASKSFMKKITSMLSRENVILYGIISGEEVIDISQTQGDVIIPVIDKDQILENLKRIDSKRRKTIGYIHVSTIQMILKSTFSLGIDAPMTLTLRDDRMINQNEALIATGEGNLSYGKIKFNLNYQVGMSLKDNLLDRSITLGYHLLREPLMKKGNHPFSITYRVNYALTNSHHSLTFKTNERIEIDQLFTPIVSLHEPERTFNVSQRYSRIIRDDRLISNKPEIQRDDRLISRNEDFKEIPSSSKIVKLESSIRQISNELGIKQ